MRVLVCGGRDFQPRPGDAEFLRVWLQYAGALIHGDAKGADRWAARIARKMDIEVIAFPADWELDGKAAGLMRNRRMLRDGEPDVVIAFPGGRGTAHMVRIAKEAGVRVIEVE